MLKCSHWLMLQSNWQIQELFLFHLFEYDFLKLKKKPSGQVAYGSKTIRK